MSGHILAAGLVAVSSLGFGVGAPAEGATPAPPRDLQALVDAARPGAVLRLPAGAYRAPVVIDKPLRITGEAGAVVDAGASGTVLTVRAPDVTIEGLEVRGSGMSLDHEDSAISVLAPRVRIVRNHLVDVLFGIYLRGAGDSVVDGNVIGAKRLGIARRGDAIRVWHSPRVRIEHNRAVGGRDTVVWFSRDAVIRDNLLERGRYGLHFMYSDGAVIERNRFVGNSVGAFVMFSHHLVLRENLIEGSNGPSGYGIGFKDCDGAEVIGNRIVGNRVGVFVDGSPFSQDVYISYRRNVVAYNDVGLEFQPSIERNVFTENAFVDNRQQVALDGGGELHGNRWSVRGVGNHWSDYAGYDANGDGIGDLPYRADDLFANLTSRHPNLTFFADTPAARAVDLAARAFPLLRPDPVIVDDAPLVDLPHLPAAPVASTAPSRTALVGASAALVALALIILAGSGAWPRRRFEGALTGAVT